MVRKLEILLTLAAAILLAALTSSCASDAPDPGAGGASDVISFKFKIFTDRTPGRRSTRTPRRASTRAPGVWEEPAANVAERILDPADIRILIFGESASGGTLLTTVNPAALDYHDPSANNDGYYSLSVSFSHPYFDKFRDDDIVNFRVMILANLNSVGSQYISYAEGTTVDQVRQSFAVDPEYFPTETSGIPMYGITENYLRMRKSDMTSDIESAASTAEINLIRALCKIEVFDGIVNAAVDPADGIAYPRVLGVDMLSWLDRGYIRPAHDSYASGLRVANIFNAPESDTAIAGKEVNEGLFRFYCPEARAESMRFRVAVQHAPGEAPKYYDAALRDYPDIGAELVRNHIYRFDVHAVSTFAEMNVEVADWRLVTDEFELSDIVSMDRDGFLQWSFSGEDFAVSTETYNGRQEQQLSLLNSTSGYASGTFHIVTPAGATWKAYFIPGENGVDAFEFVDIDADGNVIPGSASVMRQGSVGQKAVIHIRGRGAADSYRHWAELVVEVHTVDGTILHAPLTPAMSSRYIIYRENRF